VKACKVFLIIAVHVWLAVVLFGCTSRTQEHVDFEADEIMKSLIELWASKNPQIIDDLFIEECVYEDVPDQASYHGKEEVKAFLAELFTWSPDLKVEYTATFFKDDWAAVEWRWDGTQTGDIRGLMEATGRPYSLRGASVLEIEDGKIKRISDYYNAGRLLYQLGIKFVLPSGEVLESPE
jgi:steroid delta-isomerase-like uncharacterized protein